MNDPLPMYVRDLQDRLLVSERERKALMVQLENATRLAIFYSGRGKGVLQQECIT
jgi:hypothetical protein